MAKSLKDFHHYKGQGLNKIEKVERKVIELIYTSKIPNDQRDDSILFEFMHAAGCMEIGRIIAQKRNLDVDIASVSSILHDISVIVSGKYSDHAKKGAPIAEKLLRETGGFSEEEIKTITDAVLHHSEKEMYSDQPYSELVKDADVFECSLYRNAEGYYSLHKPPYIFKEYIKRIKNVRKELGLKIDEPFR